MRAHNQRNSFIGRAIEQSSNRWPGSFGERFHAVCSRLRGVLAAVAVIALLGLAVWGVQTSPGSAASPSMAQSRMIAKTQRADVIEDIIEILDEIIDALGGNDDEDKEDPDTRP